MRDGMIFRPELGIFFHIKNLIFLRISGYLLKTEANI